MSGDTNVFQKSSESFNQQDSTGSNQDSKVVSDSTQKTTTPSSSTQAIKISNVHSWVRSNAMLQECQSLGIDANNCNENSILAKKRLAYSTQATVEAPVISVTAFAIQNTGNTQVSVNSIALRGVPVSQENWYSCDPLSCGTSANLNTKLSVDYNPSDGIGLASGVAVFTSGQVSLSPSQATIIYLVNAGNLQPIDAGNTYTLQVQGGQASAVQQVQVISTG